MATSDNPQDDAGQAMDVASTAAPTTSDAAGSSLQLPQDTGYGFQGNQGENKEGSYFQPQISTAKSMRWR